MCSSFRIATDGFYIWNRVQFCVRWIVGSLTLKGESQDLVALLMQVSICRQTWFYSVAITRGKQWEQDKASSPLFAPLCPFLQRQ